MPVIVDMNQPVAYWANTPLLLFGAYKPVCHPVNLLPNLSLQAGTILGEVTASLGTFGPYAGSTVASPAAITPTLATSATGGFLAGNTTYYVVFTYRNGVGETVKSTEASIAVPAGTSTNTITVTTPSVLPTGAIGISVYLGTTSGTDYLVGMTPNTTYVIQSSPSGTVTPPGSSTAIAATNGQQNAKCILENPVTTDGNGNIYIGNAFASTTGIPIVNVQQNALSVGLGGIMTVDASIEALFGGVECWLSDLYGADQAMITAGFGRIENGTFAAPSGAIFRLP